MDQNNNEKKPRIGIPVAIVATGAIIALTIFYKYGVSFSLMPKSVVRDSDSSRSVEADQQKNLDNIRPMSEKDHILGNLNAPVKIVEFSDTECPFCKNFHFTMKDIIKNYGDKAVWAYRYFPIEQLHPVNARAEAVALECANELGGNSAFWAYLDKLFEVTPSNNQLDQSLLPVIAESVGVNRTQFITCATSDKYAARISEDWQEAVTAGAEATPFIVVIAPNGKKYSIVGAQSYATVASIIDLALKEK